jgi:hypothetical protein
LERPKGRIAAAIAVSIFVLIIFSFFILRVSLSLMNQRSDLNLLLGITGVAVIVFIWVVSINKLFKVMGCRECRKTEAETTTKEEE